MSLVAVDAGLRFSSQSAVLSLWTESDKIFVRVDKSEATEASLPNVATQTKWMSSCLN